MDKGRADEFDELTKELRDMGLPNAAKLVEDLKPPSERDRWIAERDSLVKGFRAAGEEEIAKMLEGMKPPSEFGRVVKELCEAGLPRTAEWLRKQNLARDHSPEYAHWLASRAKASAKAFEEMVEEVKKGAESAPSAPLTMHFDSRHRKIVEAIEEQVQAGTIEMERAVEMLKCIELEDGGKPG